MTLTSSNCSTLRLLVLISLISLFSFSAFSQGQSGYNLLWQISGNGLKKPSYLFGSLHLKDRRLFNFSDSVMLALSSCSSFALEVHPDSMINSLLKGEVEGKDFKSLLKQNYDKPDDMQTFTDAYLYGIAKTLRKKIIGLEQIQNQLDELESWSERFGDADDENGDERRLVEEMIEIYSRGNLDEIWVFMMKMDSDIGNIVGRNKVMANTIAEVIKGESLFATVGAAHMPGEDGIIALLKKAGYVLRPVNATFTGQAAKYKIDHSKMEWFSYMDSTDNFRISFPAKPFEMKVETGVKTLVYPDLTNGATYAVISAFSGPIAPGNTKKYVDSLLQNYLRSDSLTVIERKEIMRNGIYTLDLVLKNTKQFSRVQMFHRNNIFYFLVVANAVNNLKEAYVDLFLNSFQTIDRPMKLASWTKYHNDEGSFSLMMPGSPEYMKTEVPNAAFPDHPYVIHMYVAVDRDKQATYIVRYNDFPTGMYLSDRKLVLEGLVKEFSAKGNPVGSARTIYKNGLEGRELEVLVQGTMMEFKFFVKANRTYVLLRQNLSGPLPLKGDSFFESFLLEKPKSPQGISSMAADLGVLGPEKFVLMKPAKENLYDTDSFLWNSKNYAAKNQYTGGAYSIEEAQVSPYYRNLHLDSLYKGILDRMLDEGDSVYKAEDSKVGAVPARQVYYINTNAGTSQRTKIWIDKDRFYSQTVIADETEMESNTVADFFNNVKSNVKGTFDIMSSKAAFIMKDLGSADTTVSKRAMGSLRYYEFDTSELPVIYGALKRKYTNDTTSMGTRVKLMAELIRLNDSSTLPVLKEIFNDKSNADPVRAEVLSMVTKLDKANYDWYVKALLTEKPLVLSDSRWLFAPLRDSISLAAEHMDGLFSLLGHKPYHQNLLYLFNNMLEKTVRAQYLPLFEQRRAQWERYVIKDMDEALQKTNDLENLDFQLIYTYLELMPALKFKELTDKYTRKLFAVDSITHLHTSALAARILAGLDLDPKLLSQKLDSLDTRMEIMKAFNDAGRLTEVPQKYKKHSEFARLCFHDFLIDDADSPADLALLGQFVENQKTYYVFQFDYLDDEGKTKTYIGVCGAFDDTKEELPFDDYGCFTKYGLKTANWMEDAKALIAE